jgi:threonine synthase
MLSDPVRRTWILKATVLINVRSLKPGQTSFITMQGIMRVQRRSTLPTRPLCVGHTPVFSLPELSNYFGIKHLWVKDESANPLGTHKDRKSLTVVRQAMRLAASSRPQAFCILTAGNAGLSLARFASSSAIPVIAFIGEDDISPTLKAELESACERVIRLDLNGHEWNSQELCDIAGATLGRRVLDVTNGVIDPYSAIVSEICLLSPERRPDVIVMPVGCGELFLGVERGLKRHGLKARLVGATTQERSIADKLYARWRPHGNHVTELTLNGSPHHLLNLRDESLLLDTYNWLRLTNLIKCEPSSAAAFTALFKIKSQLRPDEKVMVINTGTFLQN